LDNDVVEIRDILIRFKT